MPAIDTDPDVAPRLGAYLSRTDVAARIGLSSVKSLPGLQLPQPDVTVGRHPGWLPETIDKWNESRPGRGYWGQRGSGGAG